MFVILVFLIAIGGASLQRRAGFVPGEPVGRYPGGTSAMQRAGMVAEGGDRMMAVGGGPPMRRGGLVQAPAAMVGGGGMVQAGGVVLQGGGQQMPVHRTSARRGMHGGGGLYEPNMAYGAQTNVRGMGGSSNDQQVITREKVIRYYSGEVGGNAAAGGSSHGVTNTVIHRSQSHQHLTTGESSKTKTVGSSSSGGASQGGSRSTKTSKTYDSGTAVVTHTEEIENINVANLDLRITTTRRPIARQTTPISQPRTTRAPRTWPPQEPQQEEHSTVSHFEEHRTRWTLPSLDVGHYHEQSSTTTATTTTTSTTTTMAPHRKNHFEELNFNIGREEKEKKSFNLDLPTLDRDGKDKKTSSSSFHLDLPALGRDETDKKSNFHLDLPTLGKDDKDKKSNFNLDLSKQDKDDKDKKSNFNLDLSKLGTSDKKSASLDLPKLGGTHGSLFDDKLKLDLPDLNLKGGKSEKTLDFSSNLKAPTLHASEPKGGLLSRLGDDLIKLEQGETAAMKGMKKSKKKLY